MFGETYPQHTMKYMRISRVSVLLCIVAAFTQSAAAQQTDTAKKDTVRRDSVQNEQLIEGSSYILKADSARRADSLRQTHLLEELSRLKTTDNLKKVELLTEIEQLRNADKVARERQRTHIDSLRAHVKGFPVVVFRDTLFYIYARLGPYTPSARAQRTMEQVERITDHHPFHPDSIRIIGSDESVDLVYRGEFILSVTDMDAIWANTNRLSLAESYRQVIAGAVSRYHEQTHWTYILRNTGIAAVIVIVLFFIIRLANAGYRRVRLVVIRGKNKWYHGIRIRDYELFSTKAQSSLFLFLADILRWLVLITLVYVALFSLFGIFPWTKPVADTLWEYMIAPLRKIAVAVWNYLPNLITIIIILFISRYVLRAFRFFRDEIARGALTIPGFYQEWANPTYYVVKVLFFAFLLVVIFPYLPGSDSPVFKGVSVFLGVLLTFGSSGSLSNIIAGLVLTYTRAFRVGDRVKIGEAVGDITEKNLLVTRLRTINNEDITIPNSAVMNNHTINFSTNAHTDGLCLSTVVKIGYDVPWRKVHELLLAAARETPLILSSPEPYVLQKALDDVYVRYEINAYTDQPNRQAGIYSQLHQHIQDQFNKAGISLVTPVYWESSGENRTKKNNNKHDI